MARRTLPTNHVIRSHKQHPFTTCNLSVDEANPRVHVRGRPWSSVAVDVPTDVNQEALRSWPLTGRMPAAKHLILGQELGNRGWEYCARLISADPGQSRILDLVVQI